MKNDALTLSKDDLLELLSRIDSARVGLIGDICLDAYWHADMTRSELSRETPHYPLPIINERYSPGGAGNTASNIVALKPRKFDLIGIAGQDWRGDVLMHALSDCGIASDGIVRSGDIITNAYIKPMRHGITDVVYEDPRIDFANYAPPSHECEEMLLCTFTSRVDALDAICVCDQLQYGCITPNLRYRLQAIAEAGKVVIADSRYNIGLYSGAIIKPNEAEAKRAFDADFSGNIDTYAKQAGIVLQKSSTKAAVITLGEKGCVVADSECIAHISACPVKGNVDFCGAGDSFMAGLAAALAVGANLVHAAQLGTLCAAVTVKKIGETGTASRDEIITAYDLYGGVSVRRL